MKPQRRNGALERTRTADPLLTMEVLYQLSYKGKSLGKQCYPTGPAHVRA